MSAEFYQTEETVQQYLELADGYDGALVVDKLYRHLSSQSNLLELGSGPGKDLALLKPLYNVTGSDFSPLFLSKIAKEQPEIPLLELNAVDIQTDLRFHCIYSNKVLHHLSKDELKQSVANQLKRLEPGGLVCHSFWKGEGEEFHSGLRFQKYTAPEIIKMFAPEFEVIEMVTYTEMEKDDSILFIGTKTHW